MLSKLNDWSIALHVSLFPPVGQLDPPGQRVKAAKTFTLLMLIAAAPLFAQTNADIGDNPLVKFAWMIVRLVLYGMGGIFAIWGLIGAIVGAMGDDHHRRNAGFKKLIAGMAIFGAMPLVDWVYQWWVANSGTTKIEDMYIPGVND